MKSSHLVVFLILFFCLGVDESRAQFGQIVPGDSIDLSEIYERACCKENCSLKKPLEEIRLSKRLAKKDKSFLDHHLPVILQMNDIHKIYNYLDSEKLKPSYFTRIKRTTTNIDAHVDSIITLNLGYLDLEIDTSYIYIGSRVKTFYRKSLVVYCQCETIKCFDRIFNFHYYNTVLRESFAGLDVEMFLYNNYQSFIIYRN